MTTFLHDIDLGPKPDAHNQHRVIYNGKTDPLLLTILHYLRDESTYCIRNATAHVLDGNVGASQLELGAHQMLVQAFTKINDLRTKPLETDS